LGQLERFSGQSARAGSFPPKAYSNTASYVLDVNGALDVNDLLRELRQQLAICLVRFDGAAH
jgi:hypothetical protein